MPPSVSSDPSVANPGSSESAPSDPSSLEGGSSVSDLATPESDAPASAANPLPNGLPAPASGNTAPSSSQPGGDSVGADAGTAVVLAPPLGDDGLALPLPNDLIGAPVSGEIIYSDEASWEVNGVFQPTFEIHTPTGSYWIVKPLGTMVSMQDRAGSQWIDFSSGFRPLRGVPSFAQPPSSAITTVRDQDSQTPTHVRLTSESQDRRWQWVWDFYVTHVTFTLNRAPEPSGLGYRGVPGGSLGPEHQLLTNDGSSQSARNSFEADLPGPVEWVYFADISLGRCLFLMQHGDDELLEHYQVRDNDSAHWAFGNGQITSLPMRFSLGLLDSTDRAAIAERVRFVADVIH